MISNDCLHNYLTSRIFVCSRRSRGSQLNVVFLDRIILRVSTMFQKVGRAETCTHINVKLCILQTCPLWVKPKDPNQDCVSVNMCNDNIVHRKPVPWVLIVSPPPAQCWDSGRHRGYNLELVFLTALRRSPRSRDSGVARERSSIGKVNRGSVLLMQAMWLAVGEYLTNLFPRVK